MNAPERTAWDQLSRPPKEALKTIQAGRLKGMSDVNPQWRYKAMHDVYGPCGIGWKYEISRSWIERGHADVVFQFAEVLVYVRSGNEWSAPIPGVGGSQLIAKESGGMHNNDEALKMAVTDALSVALKMLGVAADIYMGKWDGSKYKSEPTAPQQQTQIPNASKTNQQAAFDSLSPEQQYNIRKLAMDFIDEQDPRKAWDYYCQIRDNLGSGEEKAALRLMIPDRLKPHFNKFVKQPTAQELAGQA